MDDIDSKIADMESDVQKLSAAIEALADRLGRGENTVRAELSLAIRRRHALASDLYALKIATGRANVEPEVLYGPPRDPDPPRSVLDAQGSEPGPRPSADDGARTDQLTRGGLLRRFFRRE